MAQVEAPQADIRPAKTVVYCGVCTLPPEYCEYGGTVKKCSDWLSTHHPSLHETLYGDQASQLSSNLSALSVDAQKRAERDAAKKTARAEAAETREAEKRAASKIVIKRVERNKRKYVTEVAGLELFGLELKKVAKEFGKKFATGSSVTKAPGGLGEEITVQGDVAEEIAEWIEEHHGEAIPEDNVEIIEDKKKKQQSAA